MKIENKLKLRDVTPFVFIQTLRKPWNLTARQRALLNPWLFILSFLLFGLIFLALATNHHGFAARLATVVYVILLTGSVSYLVNLRK